MTASSLDEFAELNFVKCLTLHALKFMKYLILLECFKVHKQNLLLSLLRIWLFLLCTAKGKSKYLALKPLSRLEH